MNWLILIAAGLFEIVWAIGLKYTEGFSRFWPSAITLAAMAVSVGLLGIAMKGLPVGTAYADLGWRRRRRHRDSRHHPVRRIRQPRAPIQPRPDRLRHHRPETSTPA